MAVFFFELIQPITLTKPIQRRLKTTFFSLNTFLHIRFFVVTGRTKAIDEFVNCFRLTVTRNIESIDNPRHRVFSCSVGY